MNTTLKVNIPISSQHHQQQSKSAHSMISNTTTTTNSSMVSTSSSYRKRMAAAIAIVGSLGKSFRNSLGAHSFTSNYNNGNSLGRSWGVGRDYPLQWLQQQLSYRHPSSPSLHPQQTQQHVEGGTSSSGHAGYYYSNNYSNNNNFTDHHNTSSSMNHAASINELSGLEDRFCRDFVCCGLQLENLHDLLQHFEEHHVHVESDVEYDYEEDGLPFELDSIDDMDTDMDDVYYGGDGSNFGSSSFLHAQSIALSEIYSSRRNASLNNNNNNHHHLGSSSNHLLPPTVANNTMTYNGSSSNINQSKNNSHNGISAFDTSVVSRRLSIGNGASASSAYPHMDLAASNSPYRSSSASVHHTHGTSSNATVPSTAPNSACSSPCSTPRGGMKRVNPPTFTVTHDEPQTIPLAFDGPTRVITEMDDINMESIPPTMSINHHHSMGLGSPFFNHSEFQSSYNDGHSSSASTIMTDGDDERDDRPYKCKLNGCTKAYKNPGGLKYHMLHGHCEDTGNPEINNILNKPYQCNVPDCGKRYKNLNGLKYHIEHSHASLINHHHHHPQQQHLH